MFRNVSPRIFDVTALTVHFTIVVVRIFDKVMIKYLTKVLARPHFPTSLALGFHGIAVHQPIADIQIVDVLLVDMVSTEPVEVVPVSHLVFHFGVTLLAWAIPNASPIPVAP